MFDLFIKKIAAELKNELPGFSAQKYMAPLGRRNPNEYIKAENPPKISAVLLLLYPEVKTQSVNTVFIVRPMNESGNHAGQISFPGGGVDETDIDLAATALRETEEEIGVKKDMISLLGALTPLYIPVSNYMVHPFVGMIDERIDFKKHPAEVADIVECGISKLFSEDSKSTVLMHLKIKNREENVPCYRIDEKIIWGATAMMLSEFEEIVRRIQ
ncbi:MAG TPA: CoA pyrophosphatase [Bacteroidia bacterium]